MRCPDLVSVRMNRIHSYVRNHAFLAELETDKSTQILTEQQQKRAREITASQLIVYGVEIDQIYPKVEERIKRDEERIKHGYQSLRRIGLHKR